MRARNADVAPIESKKKSRSEVTHATLEALFSAHTGKVTDKWSSYLIEYERILAPLRDMPVMLFEIGIQNGGSLEVWAEYFVRAERIIGCDVNPKCGELAYDDPRIVVIVGDANTEETQQRVVQESRSFDIIIDDGSHRSSDIVKSFARYFPLLNDGGVFIIEDLHCSYWQEFEGGLFDPFSAMTFLKRLTDIVNHEHWGIPKFRTELLRGVLSRYDVQLHEQDLGRIHSIEFSNSMCVIRKGPTDANQLGTRLIVGEEENVQEGIRSLQAMPRPETPYQDGNPSSRIGPPEDELRTLQEELLMLRAEVAPLADHVAMVGALRGELASREAVLGAMQEQSVARDERIGALEQELSKVAAERTSWQRALSERDRHLANFTQETALTLNARDKDVRVARRETDAIQRKVDKVQAELASARAELKQIKATASWRLTKPLRKARKRFKEFGPSAGYGRATRRVRKVLREKGLLGATKRAFDLLTGRASLAPVPTRSVARAPASLPAPKPSFPINPYDFTEWVRHYDTLTVADRAGLAARAEAFAQKPLITVVVPTYNPTIRWLSEAVESVKQQIYPYWELCIVDDASTRADVRSVLESLAASDPRIRVHFRERNGHISRATNDGIAMARGEWVALLDHDDVLREHALFWVADAINKQPAARLIYSDEDKLLSTGLRCSPYFKPDWNPDLFLSHNLICHLGVYQTALLRELGGCRESYEGAQDYDLALRYTERLSGEQIHHIPRVLYSWRIHEESTASDGDAKPYAALAGKRALDDHFARQGILATAELEPSVSYRTRYALPSPEPLVTIIIPTRNGEKLVRQCIESVVRRTTYLNYEILLIDNGSDDPSAVKYFNQLARDEVIRILRDDRPFNYSALNNVAVKQARGDFVCLLNNDIEVITAEWLSEMVSIGIQPGVGAVGARLWYPDDRLQHGGVVLGIGGVAGHAHKGYRKGDRGYFGRAALIQSFSAVTGACLLVRKSAFEQVGGLNETELAVAFNDVDFCLRLREAGYRNVWTPYAELYHHESASRGYEDSPEKQARFSREVRYMLVRWGPLLPQDPAYNPNLTLVHEDFRWSWPPRL